MLLCFALQLIVVSQGVFPLVVLCAMFKVWHGQ